MEHVVEHTPMENLIFYSAMFLMMLPLIPIAFQMITDPTPFQDVDRRSREREEKEDRLLAQKELLIHMVVELENQRRGQKKEGVY